MLTSTLAAHSFSFIHIYTHCYQFPCPCWKKRSRFLCEEGLFHIIGCYYLFIYFCQTLCSQARNELIKFGPRIAIVVGLKDQRE